MNSSCFDQSKNEIYHNRCQQGQRQHGGSDSVIETALASDPDTLCSPVEGGQRIYHGRHGDKCEQPSRYAADLVAKVEEADGQTAQDDGEVEP